MNTVAVIQARMGSTRLPGKVMLSLDCRPVIDHVVRRVNAATKVDSVVVATSTKSPDDIIDRYGRRAGAAVSRGSESNVQARMYEAADDHNADTVVRLTADNPLVSPSVIDQSIQKLHSERVDYVSNKIDRSFPAGLDVETFTFESFIRVKKASDAAKYREHVTPLYRESTSFECRNVASDEVFDEPFMQNRTGLRLTLDRPDDYELFSRVYDAVDYDGILDVRDAVKFIDSSSLADLNTD